MIKQIFSFKVILIIDHAFISGGAAKVAISSAKEMAFRGMDVTILSACGPIDESLLDSGVKVICLGQKDILSEPNRIKAMWQGIWNTKAYYALDNLLKDCNPHLTIVHNHGWTKGLSASVFAATAKHKMKVVSTLHEFFLICPNGGLFNYPKNTICHLTPSSIRCLFCNCDSRSYIHKMWRLVRQIVQNRLVAMNKHLYLFSISDLTEHIYRNKTSLPFIKNVRLIRVNNPVELSDGKQADIIHNVQYLFMARLSQEKGIDLFCEAISILGLRGVVVGGGYLLEKYRKKYPNILFTGWKLGKEKEEIICNSKALIFSSYWYECAPLTITEVQSYGLPCIVPDQCAASEKIIDGETGFIFSIGELESLKNAILRLEACNLQAMQQNIVNSFNPQEYSVKNHVDNLQRAYELILNE